MGIYEDVALLQEQMATVQTALDDSGWITLPLASGVLAYSEAQKPMYKKLGK